MHCVQTDSNVTLLRTVVDAHQDVAELDLLHRIRSLPTCRAEQPPERRLAAIVLIAAPFVGDGGWPGDEFELTNELGGRLPAGVPVHVFHGLRDETVPPSHAGLYALAIPHGQVYQLPGRDHQLNNDLSEVAEAVRISRPRSP
jgi:pimeloyl-ACP methyl ester carboxylesterase